MGFGRVRVKAASQEAVRLMSHAGVRVACIVVE